jgi:hypothetical protein
MRGKLANLCEVKPRNSGEKCQEIVNLQGFYGADRAAGSIRLSIQ